MFDEKDQPSGSLEDVTVVNMLEELGEIRNEYKDKLSQTLTKLAEVKKSEKVLDCTVRDIESAASAIRHTIDFLAIMSKYQSVTLNLAFERYL